MRHSFNSNWACVHEYAQRNNTHGKSSSIFFEYDKIYSYGYHYQIAEFIDNNTILINDVGYSVSTGKHISLVRQATNHYKQFFVTKHDLKYVYSHVKNYLYPKLIKARKPYIYSDEIEYLWNCVNEYIEYRNLKVKRSKEYKYINRLINQINSDNFKQNLNDARKKAIKAERIAKERKARKEAKELKDNIKKFKSFEKGYFRSNEQYLRINGNNIETSMGAKVDIKEAKILYKLIKSGKDIKGYKIDNFTVIGINGTLKIGCHNINKADINETGEKLLKLEL